MVTVCVTTFNRWESCCVVVSAIQQQTYSDFELIIVDDCSSSAAPPSLARLVDKDPRITLIRNGTNMGLSKARNIALTRAAGTFFTFCDDDDLWGKDHLEMILKPLLLVGDLSSACSFGVPSRYVGWLAEGDYGASTLTDYMRLGLTPPVGSQIYSTKLLRDVGGYDERVNSGVDHSIWVRLLSVDPKVYLAPGVEVSFCGDPSSMRITTNWTVREKKIKSSLELWREDIENTLGKNFYVRFVSSYRYHLLYRYVRHHFCAVDLRAIITLSANDIIFFILNYIRKKLKSNPLPFA